MKTTQDLENSVPQWFSGRNVLVTGATGFMGKVLVEKLLRCCQDVSAIYILIRPKRGQDSYRRLEDFINSAVFDKIRDEEDATKLLDKIKCLPGEITQKNLNLSIHDLYNLQTKISVIFHMAANVRFDQPLKTALHLNTAGTLNVLEVAQTLPKLIAFVHVSTAYCHCDEIELEERPYKASHSAKNLLNMVAWMDDDLINKLTASLIKSAPNTYAYTKSVTEDLVAEYNKVFPVAIVRPSIVTAAWKEPVPGWVENLNGPTGLLVGAGKGVIRSMHCRADYSADIMPVDIAINHIVLAAYQLGRTTSQNMDKLLVINVCKGEENPVTWGEALALGKKHLYKNPFTVCLWYPNGSIKSNYVAHMISVLLFHIIPAYFVDFLMTLLRQKPFLVQTQKRIQSGLEVLQYYTTRKWMFHNQKIKQISKSLSDQDRKIFYTDITDLNWDTYLLNYVLGARKYCVHEEPHTIPKARKILRRLYILDCIKNVILLLLLFWLFWNYALVVLRGFENILESTIGISPVKFKS